MAPEELSLEDVQQLQKLNRELHAENIKKTLSSMMLEQDYNSLLGFNDAAFDENLKLI
jgi:hypothetical protein